MNFGFALLIMITAGLFGRKKPLIGAALGCVLTLASYFYSNQYEFRSFLINLVIGFFVSFAAAYIMHFFSSGFRGGNHNTGPSYMGDGAGFASGSDSGIIESDQEREQKKR